MPDDQLAVETASELVRAIGAWRRARDADDPFANLASLDLPVYVTTDWTTLLEDALAEAGKAPVVQRFERFAENTEQPEAIAAPPTVDESLVYHLFGTLDKPDSLVITNDDYFSWLDAWNRQRPLRLTAAVGRALTRRSLLFLGYQVDDWDFRILFQSIKALGRGDQLRRRPHVAVMNAQTSMIEPESAQDYIESYLGNDKVSIYWGSARRFLDELHEVSAADPGSAARDTEPKVGIRIARACARHVPASRTSDPHGDQDGCPSTARRASKEPGWPATLNASPNDE